MLSVSKGGVGPSLMSETSPPGPGNALGPSVLFVATSTNDGGIERYSVRMADALTARGVNLAYACRAGGMVDLLCREQGVRTYPFTVRNSGDMGAARRLAALLLEQQIDLVHVHSRRDYVPALASVALARARRRPRSPRLVLHAHMLRPLGEPPHLSGRLFRWAADAVLAVSQAVRERILRDHGLPPSFVRLLHNGVEVASFASPETSQAAAQRRAARQAWGIPADALVLGMIGRLDAKGQDALLTVAPELLRRFPALHFVFVGAEGEPGAREALCAQAQAGGITHRLRLAGPSDDVPALLPGFDVLVHLPRDESFGLALVEGMAAGLPAVATDIGGCREVVQDGVTGLLTQTGDGSALTAAVTRLLESQDGPRLRRQMGAAGRQMAEAEFSLPRQMDRLQGIYRELCPRGTPPR